MIESSRRDIYACLAKCYQLPGQRLRQVLEKIERQLRVLESRALPQATLMRNSFIANKNIKDLQVEFARLFAGPYTLLAPPYGSVYMESERRIMGESTMDVIHYYHEAGLDVATTCKDLPDHIATELEFMYFLIHEEINALAMYEDKSFLEILRIQKAFLNSHLNRWIQPFTESIKGGTQSDFYVNLADVSHIFVAEDSDYLLNLEIHADMYFIQKSTVLRV